MRIGVFLAALAVCVCVFAMGQWMDLDSVGVDWRQEHMAIDDAPIEGVAVQLD
jgi:hypothetical protein